MAVGSSPPSDQIVSGIATMIAAGATSSFGMIPGEQRGQHRDYSHEHRDADHGSQAAQDTTEGFARRK